MVTSLFKFGELGGNLAGKRVCEKMERKNLKLILKAVRIVFEV